MKKKFLHCIFFILFTGCNFHSLEKPVELELYQKRVLQESLTKVQFQIQQETPKTLSSQAKEISLHEDTQVRQSLSLFPESSFHKLEEIYAATIAHSNKVKMYEQYPLIQETSIEEAKAAFDPVIFLEGQYDHRDEPIGSTLKTGNTGYFEEDTGTWKIGVKNKVITGAQVSLSQELKLLDNNSQFTVPNPQNQAKLAFTVSQPLLRGGGLEYNRSIVKIALLDTQSSQQEAFKNIESHLMEVTKAYWSLYLTRVHLVQEQKMVSRLEKILLEMQNRSAMDVLPNQISRARADLLEVQSSIIRTKGNLRNLQLQLQSLVNSPDFRKPGIEIIPKENLTLEKPSLDLNQSLTIALKNRSEVKKSFLEIWSCAIREKIAEHEIMPVLNLIASVSIEALRENGNPRTFSEQFEAGRPSFSVGGAFELPWGNRAARAKLEKTVQEKKRFMYQFQEVVDQVLLEVRAAYEEVENSYLQIQTDIQACNTVEEELAFLEKRSFITEQKFSINNLESLGYFLEQLLNAHNRLLQAQKKVAQSIVSYHISLAQLRRVTGTFLQYLGK